MDVCSETSAVGSSSLAPVGRPECAWLQHGARPAVQPAWLLPRGCPGLPRRPSTAKHGPSARAQATGQAKAPSGGLSPWRSSRSQRSERGQRSGGCHGCHAEAPRGDDAVADLQSLRRLQLRGPVRLPSRNRTGVAPRNPSAPGRAAAGRALCPQQDGMADQRLIGRSWPEPWAALRLALALESLRSASWPKAVPCTLFSTQVERQLHHVDDHNRRVAEQREDLLAKLGQAMVLQTEQTDRAQRALQAEWRAELMAVRSTSREARLQPRAPRPQPHASRLQPRAVRLQPHASGLQPRVFRLQPHASRLSLVSGLQCRVSRLQPRVSRLQRLYPGARGAGATPTPTRTPTPNPNPRCARGWS